MNTADNPHGPRGTEESLCCAEPRTSLNSCNNAITLDLRGVSSQILERFSPEESSVIFNCSLISDYGNKAAMVKRQAQLERQNINQGAHLRR